jgi:hypothetical protein
MYGRRLVVSVVLVTSLLVPVAGSARADDLPGCSFGGNGDPLAATGVFEGIGWDFLPDYQVAAGFWLHTDIGFSSPGSGSVSIDWGDGSPVQSASAPDPTPGGPLPPMFPHVADAWWVHTYAAQGTYITHWEISGVLVPNSDGTGTPYACGDSFDVWVQAAAGGADPPDPALVAKINALKKARSVLEKDRQQMLDAVKELEDKNDVFCMVSGQMLGVLKPSKVTEVSWDKACGAIPTVISSLLEAEKKIKRMTELINKLTKEITRLEASLVSGGNASRGLAPRLLATTRLAPVTKLGLARTSALDALHVLADALDNGQTAVAGDRAEVAADKLEELAARCTAAKRAYVNAGLGKTATRAQIISTLNDLKPSALSPRMLKYGQALGLTLKQLKARVAKAKDVPRARIKATNPTQLICSPLVSPVEDSMADALHELAQAL